MSHTKVYNNYSNTRRMKPLARYEFGCNNGHKFEKVVRVDDRDREIVCEECGEVAVRTVEIYRTNFIMKN